MFVQSQPSSLSPKQTLVSYLFHQLLKRRSVRQALLWHTFGAAILTQFLFLFFFFIFRDIPVVTLTCVLLAFSIGAVYQRNQVTAAICCSTQLIFLIYLATRLATGIIPSEANSIIESSVLLYSAVVTCLVSTTIIIATFLLAVSLRLGSPDADPTVNKAIKSMEASTPPHETKEREHELSAHVEVSRKMPNEELEEHFALSIQQREDAPIEKTSSGSHHEVLKFENSACVVDPVPAPPESQLFEPSKGNIGVGDPDRSRFNKNLNWNDRWQSAVSTTGRTSGTQTLSSSSSSALFSGAKLPSIASTPHTANCVSKEAFQWTKISNERTSVHPSCSDLDVGSATLLNDSLIGRLRESILRRIELVTSAVESS